MTKSANSSHFSCLELYLLKHPQLIDKVIAIGFIGFNLKSLTFIKLKYEKLLAKNNELKSNLLSWLRNEDLFWKWMVIIRFKNVYKQSINGISIN